MHGPNPGGLAYLVFKKLSRVGLSAQARVPEMSFFFFFKGRMSYRPPLIFLEEKKKQVTLRLLAQFQTTRGLL